MQAAFLTNTLKWKSAAFTSRIPRELCGSGFCAFEMATQTKVFNRKGREDFREDRKGTQTKIWTASSNASSCLYVRDWQLREPSLLACSFPLLAERQLLTLPLCPSLEAQRQVRQTGLFPSSCLWLQL